MGDFRTLTLSKSGQVICEFNGPQDWYKYISVRVIFEFNEFCPEKSDQVMSEFLVV